MASTTPPAAPQTRGSAGNPATFEREDYGISLREWVRIDDCCAGSDRVKTARGVYLPAPEYFPPNATITNKARFRYETYLNRAVFYNVAQWTLNGLVGDVFLRDPLIETPDQLDIVTKDADGEGISIVQQAKNALTHVLGKGRAGLFVDYPVTNGQATTVADQASGEIRPTITLYKPEHIINWKTKKRGGKTVLSLVVLKERYDIENNDGFASTVGWRYRELRLTENNVYIQRVYADQNVNNVQTFDVKGPTGQPLDEIPFCFVGSIDNSHRINPKPLLAIVDLNLAHYRNSADYEEATFMLGQPTVVASGLTERWVKNVLGGEVRVGSRGGIPLPVGADAKILQVSPNTMAKEAMDGKEKQMQSLGAKLVEVSRDVTQTATEVIVDASAATSVLQSCANNVGAAYKWALEWCGIFMGVIDYTTDAKGSNDTIKFVLESNIDLTRMSWQERGQLLKEWQANAITISEYRAKLRSGGVAYLDDDEFFPLQEDEIMKGIEQQAQLIKAEAEAGGLNNKPGGAGA